MKKFLFSLIYIGLAYSAMAQQAAVTETGEQVTLYNDGTWAYVRKDSVNAEEIKTNPVRFFKKDNSTFLLKSTRVGMGCYLDPKKWTFKKADEHEAAEYEINNTEVGLYGLMITEKLDLPLESLANIALDNAREAAPDVKVTQKEYRTVNGKKVLMMRMTGTIQDIKFSYYGYYYSMDHGATQFLVYSSDDVIESHIADIEELLNGMVTLN